MDRHHGDLPVMIKPHCRYPLVPWYHCSDPQPISQKAPPCCCSDPQLRPIRELYLNAAFDNLLSVRKLHCRLSLLPQHHRNDFQPISELRCWYPVPTGTSNPVSVICTQSKGFVADRHCYLSAALIIREQSESSVDNTQPLPQHHLGDLVPTS